MSFVSYTRTDNKQTNESERERERVHKDSLQSLTTYHEWNDENALYTHKSINIQATHTQQ